MRYRVATARHLAITGAIGPKGFRARIFVLCLLTNIPFRLVLVLLPILSFLFTFRVRLVVTSITLFNRLVIPFG